jgi:hypothetical protein
MNTSDIKTGSQEQLQQNDPFCKCEAEDCQHNKSSDGMGKPIDPATQKIIYLSNIDEDLKTRLKESIYMIFLLKEDVELRKKIMAEKVEALKNKILSLSEIYKVKMNTTDHEDAEKSVAQYAELLDGVIKELEKEMVHSYVFMNEGENKIEKLVVPIEAPDSLDIHIENRIKWTRKFTKDLHKNLSVSYSRYVFGFEEQERKIMVLESYLANQIKQRNA